MIPDDFFVHPATIYPRPMRERLYAAWRNAQRFNFSAQASAVAGRLAFEAPELVINHRQFAIPPYRTTYIEFDARAFFDAGARAGVGMVASDLPEDKRDARVGYLIDGAAVYGFSATPQKRDDLALTPFIYWTAPPGHSAPSGHPMVVFGSPNATELSHAEFSALSPAGMSDLAAGHKLGLLALLLGTAVRTTAAHLAQDDIVEAHSVEPLIPLRGTDMRGWYGDIRNVWTLLLWLNQPARCRFTDVPPSRRISRGKLKTYTSFRTVEIELGKVRSIRRAYLLGAPRTPPRDHPVRGNFHHHGGLTQGCGHDWPLEPDAHGVWECQKCQRRRWWVKSHRRGDESRGTVVHDYAIVTPEEEKADAAHP
jgi:hypothetical protein